MAPADPGLGARTPPARGAEGPDLPAGEDAVGAASSIACTVARRVRDTAGARRPIVVIDGRSGAGKSTFATSLAGLLNAELVRLDDVYPGWDGLEAGSAAVHTEIIPDSRWHRWSWDSEAHTTVHALDPGRALVIEGCGALSRGARRLATFGIWIELDEPARKARALRRDGETYRPHWERWARQEEAFAAREHPRALADLVLDGAASDGTSSGGAAPGGTVPDASHRADGGSRCGGPDPR